MPPIEFHCVTTDAQWPLEVRLLSAQLSKPLLSVSIDACISNINVYSELLDKLRGNPSSSPNAHPLSGFLDIILATVTSLRQMKEDPHPFTAPIWSTLIRALCYTCYSDVEIFDDIPFILPKNFGKSVFDGHALMLISHLYTDSHSTGVEPIPGCSDQTVAPEHTGFDYQSNNSSGDPEEVGVQWEGEDILNTEVEPDTRTPSSASDNLPMLVEDLCDERLDVSCDITQSEKWLGASRCSSSPPLKASSPRSLDVSFHAHVLPGRGHRTNAVLPIICIADTENIVPLVASVAYQRRVWGIEDPVVGVILAKDGFSAQVVLGWTDPPDLCSGSESPGDDAFDGLPTVHIAFSDSPFVANGVFNLTDPISAFAFSQFIVELRDQYDKVVEKCCDSRTAANSTFTWRSDLIDPSSPLDWGEHSEEFVASWIQGLRTPSSVDTEDDPPPYPITPPPVQLFDRTTISDPMKKVGRSDEPDTSQHTGTAQGGKQKGYKGVPTKSVSKSIISKSTSELSATFPTNASSIQSCSEFAKKAEYGINPRDRHSMTTYAYERYVLSISTLTLSSDVADREKINDFVYIYNTLSCFRDPAWQREEELPDVEGAYLEAVRRCFWRQLVAVRERHAQNIRPVDKLHEPIISERLSLFFWVTLGAFCRGQRKSVNEAESRLQWDTLIFYALNRLPSEDDEVHIRPLFERSLLLSRNRFVDALNSAETIDEIMPEARTRARDNHLLCLASSTAVYYTDRTSGDIDPMSVQEAAATSVAFRLMTETNRLFDGDKKELDKSSILRRASSEPHTGTCDAVVILTMNKLALPSSKCAIPNFITIPEDDKGLLPPLQRERHNADSGTYLLPAPSSQAGPLADKTDSTLPKPGSGAKTRVPPAPNVEQQVDDSSDKDFRQNLKQSRNSFLAASSACSDCRKKPMGDGIPQLSDEFTTTIIPFELSGKILFAILVVEHKRPGDDPTKPLNQVRIYVEASVRLLEAHGIIGLPVFALATNGNEGVVLMAWRSETSERVYLIDRCVQKFDISSPIEVFHFVTFLLRLKDYYVDHFTKHPEQIEAANRAADEMARRADKIFREAEEQGGKVEVDIDWGWWKSAQTKRPTRDKSGKSKVELGKVVEGIGSMHLSG
ncbi:hypothetical protein IW261DRAFT_1450324 [Armillaria novae-zelandiae]|uniref:Uncharacterized protein n=1 Tax=Armillaria novae-zelandiae TaxID=153914 RepID=A0AA39PP75_9AGAR|nr:hypothetical protein IW261DRAFT_1450324 [Armillaria novae-zelandiae]